MNKRDKQNIKITDLKDMLIKTEKIYASNPAYKIKEENETYKIITHKEIRQMVNYLGTSLINMGLKEKRIAVIGENRYEWELAYLSIVCGTGIGVSITANKVNGIRCSLCHDVFSAKATRQHNDSNMLAMGQRVIGEGLALEILHAWLESEYVG